MANKHIFDEKFRLSPHIFDRTLKIGAGHVPCSLNTHKTEGTDPCRLTACFLTEFSKRRIRLR